MNQEHLKFSKKLSIPDRKIPRKQGESYVYRSTLIGPDEPLVECSIPGIFTMKDQFINSVKLYGKRKFLGTREVLKSKHNTLRYGKYKFRTYNQVYEDVISLSKAFTYYNLFNEVMHNRKKHRLMGIYAKNCEGWSITDLAWTMTGIATVTLHESLGVGSSEFVIKQSELNTVVCTENHINDIINIK